MNLLLLLSVDCILGGTATRRRILLSTMLGTIGYCVLLLAPIKRFPWLVKGLGGMGVAACMVRVSFGRQRQILRRGVMLLYGCTFATGGLLVWLRRLFPYLFSNYTMPVILAGASILFLGIRGFLTSYKRNRQSVVPVQLVMQGATYKATGLFDTGNSLREPISGKPVCVLDSQLARMIKESVPVQRIVLIPFHTVGKDCGILYGARLDRLCIEDESKLTIPDAIVAFSHQNFARSEKYQILLHPGLKTERK